MLKNICISISTGDRQHTSPLDVVPRHVAHCAIKTCCPGRKASSNRILHTCSQIKFVYLDMCIYIYMYIDMYIYIYGHPYIFSEPLPILDIIFHQTSSNTHTAQVCTWWLQALTWEPVPLNPASAPSSKSPRRVATQSPAYIYICIYIYVVLSIHIYIYICMYTIQASGTKKTNLNNKHQQTISCDVLGCHHLTLCRNMEVASQL